MNNFLDHYNKLPEIPWAMGIILATFALVGLVGFAMWNLMLLVVP